jgi:hypothetical protein
MHRWGYAPTVRALADDLLGGSVSESELLRSLCDAEAVVEDGFVLSHERRDLLEKSRRRVASHGVLNGTAQDIARTFASDLGRVCPLVYCVALSGSVASGGYESDDDIDLNLFVSDEAKYFVYGMALLLSLRTTLRHRKVRGLRKLICINVLWTVGQTRPFERQDEGLAFELLHSRPILGAAHFREVLEANPWIDAYFPQIRARVALSPPMPSPRGVGKIVARVARHPRWRRALNQGARIATRAAYSAAHWVRRHDAASMERLLFLQRVKYPYEVFQD